MRPPHALGFAIALALAGSLVGDSARAQSCVGANVFAEGAWRVDGAQDDAADALDIEARANGLPQGSCSELIVAHEATDLGTPQIFSVKGSGALRPVLLPPADFGATFYMTGYWECSDLPLSGDDFHQNTFIEMLDLRRDPEDTSVLRLVGRISNRVSFAASDFVLRIFPPQPGRTRAEVSYTLVATDDFCVSFEKAHERLWAARIASNFVSDQIYDSDLVLYVDPDGDPRCEQLENQDGSILTDPQPLGTKQLFLVHSAPEPRRTPTLFLKFRRPRHDRITPQGFVTHVEGPTAPMADNVSLWGNWQRVAPAYVADSPIGRFRYVLAAVRPRPLACD